MPGTQHSSSVGIWRLVDIYSVLVGHPQGPGRYHEVLGEASLASAQEKEAIVMKDTGLRGRGERR